MSDDDLRAWFASFEAAITRRLDAVMDRERTASVDRSELRSELQAVRDQLGSLRSAVTRLEQLMQQRGWWPNWLTERVVLALLYGGGLMALALSGAEVSGLPLGAWLAGH